MVVELMKPDTRILERNYSQAVGKQKILSFNSEGNWTDR
jgi:RecB family endonuclease NucS